MLDSIRSARREFILPMDTGAQYIKQAQVRGKHEYKTDSQGLG